MCDEGQLNCNTRLWNVEYWTLESEKFKYSNQTITRRQAGPRELSTMQTSLITSISFPYNNVPFGVTYEKIGTIQRRLAWPLHKDDTLSRSGRPTGLNIYFIRIPHQKSSQPWMCSFFYFRNDERMAITMRCRRHVIIDPVCINRKFWTTTFVSISRPYNSPSYNDTPDS